jgi:hypothetical protein
VTIATPAAMSAKLRSEAIALLHAQQAATQFGDTPFQSPRCTAGATNPWPEAALAGRKNGYDPQTRRIAELEH